MSFIARSPVPLPVDIGVIADEFDLSTITTGDLVFAAVALVSSVILAMVAKRALRRILNGIDDMPVLASVPSTPMA